MNSEQNSLESAKKALNESMVHLFPKISQNCNKFLFKSINLFTVRVLYPNNEAVQKKADECLKAMEALPKIAKTLPDSLPTKKYFMDCVEKEMIGKAFDVMNSVKKNHK